MGWLSWEIINIVEKEQVREDQRLSRTYIVEDDVFELKTPDDNIMLVKVLNTGGKLGGDGRSFIRAETLLHNYVFEKVVTLYIISDLVDPVLILNNVVDLHQVWMV